ncbi:phosphoribosylanthranilate isomerase [Staphylococcus caeli]|uniref:phosphoribosylanthranilate isomerase n=1 Tax=Staphylococcus caeli TaxID=2201815 RepID=UPI003F54BC5E
MMKLKFCGFKTIADVQKAKDLNIDAIGFIHYKKSKRYVDIQTINQFIQIIPNTIEKVIVFVNPDIDTLDAIIEGTGVTAIQLHGDEPLTTIQYIREKRKNIKIIKALPATNRKELKKNIEKYKSLVDQFIIDTPSQTYGGTGQVYDWQMLEGLEDVDYLVAGGMDEQNIRKIRTLSLNHNGYDIASGIETNQEKDLTKMHTIIELVKGDYKNDEKYTNRSR